MNLEFVPERESRLHPMLPAIPIVFVVDDDISVRESLEGLIRTEGFEVQAFPSAQQFLSHARSPVPSCLVLDVNLPDLNGLELQKRVTDHGEMPIIFLTGYGDVPMTVEAMKAGAIEFLTKPFDDEVLLGAIRVALERSPREVEVMGLVVLGLMNKQVGGKLGISEITVKAHRGRLVEKMKARSLADLVRMAAALDLPTGSTG